MASLGARGRHDSQFVLGAWTLFKNLAGSERAARAQVCVCIIACTYDTAGDSVTSRRYMMETSGGGHRRQRRGTHFQVVVGRRLH